MVQNWARVRTWLGLNWLPPVPETTPISRRMSALRAVLLSLTSVKEEVPAAVTGSAKLTASAAASRPWSMDYRFMDLSPISYSARRATTGCNPEALTAGYMPKRMPSTTENRNAPMVMGMLGRRIMPSSSNFPAISVPT